MTFGELIVLLLGGWAVGIGICTLTLLRACRREEARRRESPPT